MLWKVFYHGDKELCAYTLKGTFADEEKETKQLLAYEHGIDENAITVHIEQRKKNGANHIVEIH